MSTTVLSTQHTMGQIEARLRGYDLDIKPYPDFDNPQLELRQIEPNAGEDIAGLEERLNKALTDYPFNEMPGKVNAQRIEERKLLLSFVVDPSNQRYKNAQGLVALAKGWLDGQSTKYSEELDHEGLPQLTIDLNQSPFLNAEVFVQRFPYFVLTKEGRLEFYPTAEELELKYPYDTERGIPDRSKYSRDDAGDAEWHAAMKETALARPIQGYLLVQADPDEDSKIAISLWEGSDPRDGLVTACGDDESGSGSGIVI